MERQLLTCHVESRAPLRGRTHHLPFYLQEESPSRAPCLSVFSPREAGGQASCRVRSFSPPRSLSHLVLALLFYRPGRGLAGRFRCQKGVGRGSQAHTGEACHSSGSRRLTLSPPSQAFPAGSATAPARGWGGEGEAPYSRTVAAGATQCSLCHPYSPVHPPPRQCHPEALQGRRERETLGGNSQGLASLFLLVPFSSSSRCRVSLCV